ncbi:putative lipid II flippase MurJ [Clostridia bacterium]|nr:putative lipid II flippase MurJ [Clostridia bacterium]
MTLAYAFGRSAITDAFVNAYGIPNIILSFIVGATATSYIPIYTAIDSKQKFTDNLITIFAILGISFSLLVFIAPQPFLKLVAWTAEPEVYKLSLSLMRYMAFAMIPMLIASILSAQLQVKSKFFVATVYQIFNNAFIIVGIFVAKATTFLPWIAFGLVIGNIASTMVLVVADREDLRLYKPTINLSDSNVRKFFILLAPIMLSTLVGQINTIVSQNVANSLENHAVSTLNYANKVQNVFTAFIGTAVGTAFFPEMAKTAGSGDKDGLRDQISNSLKALLPILIPITIGILLLAEPLIRILLERGQFNPEDTILTATALKFVIFTMFAGNINQMVSRGFYAMQKTKLPAIISAACVVLNILCILALVKPLQYRGLALASSISGMASMVAYYVLLKKELGSLSIYRVSEWIKLGVATTVMTVIVIVGRSLLPLMTGSYLTCLVSLVGLVGISVILYVISLIVMKTEIAGMAIGMIKNRGKNIKVAG